MSKPVLFIVGPTGSGKSKLALMLARKLKAEIVSADSMQIYQGMDIGTAKPTKKEQKLVRHHLLSSLTPRSECSVHKYQKLAAQSVIQISRKGRLPMVVGGSGFYIKALIDGLSPLPGRKSSFRKELDQLPSEELHRRLTQADPKAAAKVHVNNRKKIIRALEIIESSGDSAAYLKKQTGGLSHYGFKAVVFGINRDRKELYSRIEKRVDQMFRAGWIQEVKKLKRAGLSLTARYAIGYKEILEHLNGTLSDGQMRDQIKKRTRHLAKRQMTWFRKYSNVQWHSVSGEKYAPVLNRILKEFAHASR